MRGGAETRAREKLASRPEVKPPLSASAAQDFSCKAHPDDGLPDGFAALLARGLFSRIVL